MYNKIILAGHLTRDIEVRYTSTGLVIGNAAIATSRKFKSATGEQKEEVLFVDITFFGRTAEIANQYLRKGSKVLVDGKLKLDQWTAPDGQKRSKHSVVVENLQMIGTKGETETVPRGDNGYSQQPQGASNYNNNAPVQNEYNQSPMQQQAPVQNSYNQQQQQPPPMQQQNHQMPTQPQSSPAIPEIDISEDEIPF